MRLRELRPDELAMVAARRARVREELSLLKGSADWVPDMAAVETAPYLQGWEPVRYPGTDRTCLRGLCWGHPLHGDQLVTTTPLAHTGVGFVVTESGRLYVLGSEDRKVKRERILSGKRGKYRPAPAPGAVPSSPIEGTADDLPPIENPWRP